MWHPTSRRFLKNKDVEYVLRHKSDQTIDVKEDITIINPFDILHDESQEEGVKGKE